MRRDVFILELDYENLKQENINLVRKNNAFQHENNRLKFETLNIEKLSGTFEEERDKALAAQKDRHVVRHEQVFAKLSDRFEP